MFGHDFEREFEFREQPPQKSLVDKVGDGLIGIYLKARQQGEQYGRADL